MNSNNNFIIDLGTWVAGDLPSIGTLPVTGTATYTGHAIGSVVNGLHRYTAVGSYAMSWDFASMSGNTSIINFDGRSFSGTATASNGRDFTGALSGSGVSGTLAGSFFKGGGDPAAEAGGQFGVSNGSNYAAHGTFAARR
jgi:hypothetical protein